MNSNNDKAIVLFGKISDDDGAQVSTGVVIKTDPATRFRQAEYYIATSFGVAYCKCSVGRIYKSMEVLSLEAENVPHIEDDTFGYGVKVDDELQRLCWAQTLESGIMDQDTLDKTIETMNKEIK